MKKAFQFLQFDAMQRKIISVDTISVEKYKKIKISELESCTNNIEQYIGYEQLLTNIDGLTDIREIHHKLLKLAGNELVKEHQKNEQLYLKEQSIKKFPS